MVKISVNLDERDARVIEQLAAEKDAGSKSDIIRDAIHAYCAKAQEKRDAIHYAIDHSYGAFKESPLDGDALRDDSNESGRL